MVRKLAITSLRRGIGSMDYIETLLITEDDLDEDENFGEFSNTATNQATGLALAGSEPSNQGPIPSNTQNPDDVEDSASGAVPDWCVCGKCHPMPQEVENKCCKLKKCITLSSRFAKLSMYPDVVELCIKSTGDIRNDREDNSSRAFRKAAYRQFILACYGCLGKGNRRVCPSCVVKKIRKHWLSITGVYIGYREH